MSLDSFARAEIGGRMARTFNDATWERVRKHESVPSNFLFAFSFDALGMDIGGGKGGELLGFTPDKRFIVKSMSDGDHATLLRIADDYVAHLCGGESLICRILMHFRLEESGTTFMVMQNTFAPRSVRRALLTATGQARVTLSLR